MAPRKTSREDTERTPLTQSKKKRRTVNDEPVLSKAHVMIPLKQEVTELSSMAVQLCCRQMVRQAMTITDSAFQGHIGTKQLAGVSLAAMYMGVPSAFVQFSIQAINTLCSQAVGAENPKLVGLWLQTAIVFALLGAIPVMLWYLCVGHLIALTMDDAETVAYGQSFAQIMALGLIPQYIYGAVSTYFAAQGIIMPATFCSTLTMLLNIVLNTVLIYGVGSWDGLGFIGSPIATVTSTFLQLFFFLAYTVWYKRYHAPTWYGWSRDCLAPARVSVFLKLALPMGMSAVVDWASGAVAGAFSGYLGPELAACQSVLGGVFGLANSAVSGFSTSTQIRMSRYLGANKPGAAQRVFLLGGGIVMAGAAITLSMVLSISHTLFSLWSADPKIIALCTSTLSVFCLCILVAFGRFLMTAVMNALSLSSYNLVANNIASWLIYVPLSYLLPITLQYGLQGFWWADTFGEAFKVVILGYGLSKVNWEVAAAAASAVALEEDTDLALTEAAVLVALENEAMVVATPELFTSPYTPKAARRVVSRRDTPTNRRCLSARVVKV